MNEKERKGSVSTTAAKHGMGRTATLLFVDIYDGFVDNDLLARAASNHEYGLPGRLARCA